MTPDEIDAARQELGLTVEQFCWALGYGSPRARWHDLMDGKRNLSTAGQMLLAAYLEGYRPTIWPMEGPHR